MRVAVIAMAGAVSTLDVAAIAAKAVFIALGVGCLVAFVANAVFRRVRDVNTVTALTLTIPFVSYLPAEHWGGSGVVSVVVTGLLIGHKSPTTMDGRARMNLRSNWGTIQFLLENSVFLLIGLQVRSILAESASAGLSVPYMAFVCGAVLVCVIVLRLVWVLATRVLVRDGRHSRAVSGRESILIGWAGMRGVVTLAGALSLPDETPYRSLLILIALVVTFGTLFIQGISLPRVSRLLRVGVPDFRDDAVEETRIYEKAIAAGLLAAESAARASDAPVLELIRKQAEMRVSSLWERVCFPEDGGETPSEAWLRLRGHAIAAERAEVLRIRDEGTATHDVLSQILNALDLEEASLMRFVENRTQLRQLGAYRE